MTLIIAAVADHSVYIGADARGSTNKSYQDNCEKLVVCQNFVVGTSGSTRVSQVVQFNTKVFKPIGNRNDVFIFTAQLKRLLSEHLAESLRDGVTVTWPDEDFTILLATCVGIFCIESNLQFSVQPVASAIGWGAAYGQGYFDGSGGPSVPRRIRNAIDAAAGCTPYVGGPVIIYRVPLGQGSFPHLLGEDVETLMDKIEFLLGKCWLRLRRVIGS